MDQEEVENEEKLPSRPKRERRAKRLNDFVGEDFELDYELEEVEEVDEAGHVENLEAAEKKLEQEAAIYSDLSPNSMSELETEQLPDFIPFEDIYLQLRNVILAKWHADVTKYLVCERAISGLLKEYISAAKCVFSFLEDFGFINVGLVNNIPHRQQSGKTIIVMGAGASGLGAARQLQSFGHKVVVLEAQGRLGGRVRTETKLLSGPVDLGASIVNGLTGNPITTICKQLAARDEERDPSLTKLSSNSAYNQANIWKYLHKINDSLTIYDSKGKPVNTSIDNKTEHIFNDILSGSDTLRGSQDVSINKLKLPADADLSTMSLASAMSMVRNHQNIKLSPEEETLFQWHVNNLEYGCATDLSNLSLQHWDQDDPFGFKGDHCYLREGYGPTLIENIAESLDVRLNHVVETISYPSPDEASDKLLSQGGVRLRVKVVKPPLYPLPHSVQPTPGLGKKPVLEARK
jgi:hypothetical protein